MALPVLNDQPKYELNIPSTGQTVRYRPYLVREEKVLMLAMESQDPRHMFSAILDTIKACIVDENIKWDELAIFDVEYMFIIIRSKSVGESAKLNFKCSECEEPNELSVDLTDISPKMPDITGEIKLTEDISIQMQWPSYHSMSRATEEEISETEMTMVMIGNCIKYVNTDTDQIIVKDEPQQSINNFLESLSTSQFELIKEYTDQMPQIVKNIEYECSECSHHNKVKLQGMSDFF
tara:strand:+ start:2198 stop:2905 length:708 start_codon:yes stop_codon:yes gene_type:complete